MKFAMLRADAGSLGMEAGMTARRQPASAAQTRDTKITCSDKSTPTVRSVRKAEGLEDETARLPRNESQRCKLIPDADGGTQP